MARRKDKENAITMRKKGMSYSQIKKLINIPKGTLSNWLRDYPLSQKRIDELRGNNPVRIEKFRNTMAKKRATEEAKWYEEVSKQIEPLSERDKLIAGYFLYWGEGGKTDRYRVSLANTEPAMIKFFIEWLSLLSIPKKTITYRLTLYSDMDIQKTTEKWINYLNAPLSQFRKPYIKKTKQAQLTYDGPRNNNIGTCLASVGGKEVAGQVLQALQYIRNTYINF